MLWTLYKYFHLLKLKRDVHKVEKSVSVMKVIVSQCVVCLSAEATMQTFPCAHRVTCRRCFVRTIQTAISDRILPLRCVVCRARILTLNDPASVDDQSTCSASAARGWIVSASDDRRPKSMDPSKNAEEPAVTKKHLPRMRRKQSSPTCSMAGK